MLEEREALHQAAAKGQAMLVAVLATEGIGALRRQAHAVPWPDAKEEWARLSESLADELAMAVWRQNHTAVAWIGERAWLAVEAALSARQRAHEEANIAAINDAISNAAR